MKASSRAIAVGLTVTLPTHALLTFGLFAVATVLLVYIGIALPAVWSAKPARRKAASTVLRQVFNACTSGERR